MTSAFAASPFVRLVPTIVIAIGAAPLFAAEPLQFNRDIRPILVDTCFSCHGPDSASRQAGLRLDQRDAAVAMNAIVPGDPAGSEMLRRILSDNPDEVMPPPSSHKELTAAQKQTLKEWIANGAEYQPHWSFIPPVNSNPPRVQHTAWVRNPIDQFVLARLEAVGLTPAPEADKRTLVRRLSLDLTGLPPKPELVEAFVNNASPDAYEQLVDQLMETPQWAEHRARYWLDAARYADTHGIHFDNYREMWSYRDWVIGAFQRNLPFDQFTIEQLAGDLLPNASLDQRVATGFHRCNITTNEGGIIDEEYVVLYARDRTETTSAVWLGLTTGCAVCHDHKFDPVTQREFYELSAFFNNTTQPPRDGNIKDSPPIVVVPQLADRERWDVLQPEVAAARTAVEQRRQAARPDFDAWMAKVSPDELRNAATTDSLDWQIPANATATALTVIHQGETQSVELKPGFEWKPGPTGNEGLYLGQAGLAEIPAAGDYDKDQAFTCAAWIKLPANDGSGAIIARMDDGHDYRGWDFWVEGRRVGMHLIHRWPDDALKVVSRDQVKANEWTHVVIAYDGSQKANGVRIFINGKAQPTNIQTNSLQNTTRTKVPLKLGQRHLTSPLTGVTVNDIRLYHRALSDGEAAMLSNAARFAALVAMPAEQRPAAQVNELMAWWLDTQDAAYQGVRDRLRVLEQEEAAIKGRGTIAHVMHEKSSDPLAYVLFRGEYDKRRDQVPADTPDALIPFPTEAPRNRLGLAQWLVRDDHPLTARVTVNRFWQEVFGTGLVRTAGDFGISGEVPSHPELLDWLAVRFREDDWDVRKFFKLIVTSATYRQSAVVTPEKLEKDEANRLMSRGPRFRMDAEMIRDGALAASGLLIPKIGGPSVRPYQPDGVWEAVAMIGSNTRDYRRDTGENLYRRSMYTFWKRSAPPASMDVFNAPAREVCTVRRERTNTPLQALVTLNDPQFVEAARALAQRLLKAGDSSDEVRLQSLAQQVLARPWNERETPVVTTSLARLREYYQQHPDHAAELLKVGEFPVDATLPTHELAAWTMLCNEVLNLDEVLCK